MFTNEPIDYSDPRSVLEEKEEEQQSAHSKESEVAATIGRMMAWCFETQHLYEVGFRAYIMAKKIHPAVVNGISFESMARKLGRGRSSAHKISDHFARQFGVRGPHDKSEEARQKFREGWRRRNIICPTKSKPMPQVNGRARSSPLLKTPLMASMK